MLRAFLGSWNALEIFIHKTFLRFESKFFSELNAGDHPETRKTYFVKIREVMKGKYNIRDKFALVSLLLSPETSYADVQIFIQVKDQRDDLIHGKDIGEEELKVAEAQKLLTRYLYRFLKQT